MTERGPDWYLKASKDVSGNLDTEDARALLDEARAEYRNGRGFNEIADALKAKGAQLPWWVARQAGKLELPFIIQAASTDFEAGHGDTPNIARAREAAASLITGDASDNLRAKLKGLGASDTLIAHLNVHPDIRLSRRRAAWFNISVAIIASVVAAIFIPAKDDWQGLGMTALMLAALYWFLGIGGLIGNFIRR